MNNGKSRGGLLNIKNSTLDLFKFNQYPVIYGPMPLEEEVILAFEIRGSPPYGFDIGGGRIYYRDPIKVTKVHKGTKAYGILEEGDLILSANGTIVTHITTYEELITNIENPWKMLGSSVEKTQPKLDIIVSRKKAIGMSPKLGKPNGHLVNKQLTTDVEDEVILNGIESGGEHEQNEDSSCGNSSMLDDIEGNVAENEPPEELSLRKPESFSYSLTSKVYRTKNSRKPYREKYQQKDISTDGGKHYQELKMQKSNTLHDIQQKQQPTKQGGDKENVEMLTIPSNNIHLPIEANGPKEKYNLASPSSLLSHNKCLMVVDTTRQDFPVLEQMMEVIEPLFTVITPTKLLLEDDYSPTGSDNWQMMIDEIDKSLKTNSEENRNTVFSPTARKLDDFVNSLVRTALKDSLSQWLHTRTIMAAKSTVPVATTRYTKEEESAGARETTNQPEVFAKIITPLQKISTKPSSRYSNTNNNKRGVKSCSSCSSESVYSTVSEGSPLKRKSLDKVVNIPSVRKSSSPPPVKVFEVKIEKEIKERPLNDIAVAITLTSNEMPLSNELMQLSATNGVATAVKHTDHRSSRKRRAPSAPRLRNGINSSGDGMLTLSASQPNLNLTEQELKFIEFLRYHHNEDDDDKLLNSPEYKRNPPSNTNFKRQIKALTREFQSLTNTESMDSCNNYNNSAEDRTTSRTKNMDNIISECIMEDDLLDYLYLAHIPTSNSTYPSRIHKSRREIKQRRNVTFDTPVEGEWVGGKQLRCRSTSKGSVFSNDNHNNKFNSRSKMRKSTSSRELSSGSTTVAEEIDFFDLRDLRNEDMLEDDDKLGELEIISRKRTTLGVDSPRHKDKQQLQQPPSQRKKSFKEKLLRFKSSMTASKSDVTRGESDKYDDDVQSSDGRHCTPRIQRVDSPSKDINVTNSKGIQINNTLVVEEAMNTPSSTSLLLKGAADVLDNGATKDIKNILYCSNDKFKGTTFQVPVLSEEEYDASQKILNLGKPFKIIKMTTNSDPIQDSVHETSSNLSTIESTEVSAVLTTDTTRCPGSKTNMSAATYSSVNGSVKTSFPRPTTVVNVNFDSSNNNLSSGDNNFATNKMTNKSWVPWTHLFKYSNKRYGNDNNHNNRCALPFSSNNNNHLDTHNRNFQEEFTDKPPDIQSSVKQKSYAPTCFKDATSKLSDYSSYDHRNVLTPAFRNKDTLTNVVPIQLPPVINTHYNYGANVISDTRDVPLYVAVKEKNVNDIEAATAAAAAEKYNYEYSEERTRDPDGRPMTIIHTKYCRSEEWPTLKNATNANKKPLMNTKPDDMMTVSYNDDYKRTWNPPRLESLINSAQDEHYGPPLQKFDSSNTIQNTNQASYNGYSTQTLCNLGLDETTASHQEPANLLNCIPPDVKNQVYMNQMATKCLTSSIPETAPGNCLSQYYDGYVNTDTHGKNDKAKELFLKRAEKARQWESIVHNNPVLNNNNHTNGREHAVGDLRSSSFADTYDEGSHRHINGQSNVNYRDYSNNSIPNEEYNEYDSFVDQHPHQRHIDICTHDKVSPELCRTIAKDLMKGVGAVSSRSTGTSELRNGNQQNMPTNVNGYTNGFGSNRISNGYKGSTDKYNGLACTIGQTNGKIDRGAEIFARRRLKSQDWVVDSNISKNDCMNYASKNLPWTDGNGHVSAKLLSRTKNENQMSHQTQWPKQNVKSSANDYYEHADTNEAAFSPRLERDLRSPPFNGFTYTQPDDARIINKAYNDMVVHKNNNQPQNFKTNGFSTPKQYVPCQQQPSIYQNGWDSETNGPWPIDVKRNDRRFSNNQNYTKNFNTLPRTWRPVRGEIGKGDYD